MTYRRLILQAIAVIFLGTIVLLTPEPTEAGSSGTTTMRIAQSANMCGSWCGVCDDLLECPSKAVQDEGCQSLCHMAESCDDCGTDTDDCLHPATHAWWCDG